LKSYIDDVERYEREKETYGNSSKIKKFFRFKPSLGEEDDEEPFT
jgi:uncharacterized protein (UPF0335 family)